TVQDRSARMRAVSGVNRGSVPPFISAARLRRVRSSWLMVPANSSCRAAMNVSAGSERTVPKPVSSGALILMLDVGFDWPVVVCWLESVVVLRACGGAGRGPCSRVWCDGADRQCKPRENIDDPRRVRGGRGHALRRVPQPVGSAELSGFGGAFQSGGRGLRVECRRDQIEVSGADLTLVAGRGVTAVLGSELALLQVDVGLHLLAGVAVSEIEHRVVE